MINLYLAFQFSFSIIILNISIHNAKSLASSVQGCTTNDDPLWNITSTSLLLVLIFFIYILKWGVSFISSFSIFSVINNLIVFLRFAVATTLLPGYSIHTQQAYNAVINDFL